MADRKLPVLEPPPGGLAMLRERLDAVDRRAARIRRFTIPVLAVAAAAVAIAVWLGTDRAQPTPPAPSVATMPLPDPSIGNGVAFYWVSPSEPVPSRSPPPAVVDISAVSISP